MERKEKARVARLSTIMLGAARSIGKYAQSGRRRRFRDDLFNSLRLHSLMKQFPHACDAPDHIREEMRRLTRAIKIPVGLAKHLSSSKSKYPPLRCPKHISPDFFKWIRLHVLLHRYPQPHTAPSRIRGEIRDLSRYANATTKYQRTQFTSWVSLQRLLAQFDKSEIVPITIRDEIDHLRDALDLDFDFLDRQFRFPKAEPGFLPGAILVQKSDLEKILELQEVEPEIISQYHRMIYKLVNRSRRRIARSPIIDEEDLYQCGMMALRDAAYNYDRPDICFHTFAWRAIIRRISLMITRSLDVRARSRRHEHLLLAFQNARMRDPAPSDDQIMERLIFEGRNLSDEDKRMLKAFNRQFERPEQYSQYGDGGRIDGLEVIQDPFAVLDLELISFSDLVSRSGLTPMEHELVMATQDGEWGYQTAIARKYINPETGKPYSRTTPKNYLIRAYEKMERTRKESLKSSFSASIAT